MTPEIIGAIGLILLLVLLVCGLPIAFSLGLVGIAGLAVLLTPEAALIKSGVVAFHTIHHYELGVLPMFLLMAHVAFETGASRQFYDAAAKFVGHRRGGLAMATVAGCAGFGTVSGSSLATVATMGAAAVPEMRKQNYDLSLISGSVVAGGTLGSMIPPSGVLIVIGILTQQSIGKLFAAAVVPGLSQALFYIVTITLLCRFFPGLGPVSPRHGWRARLLSLRDSIDMLILVVFVIGGLLVGWFTPTESGAVGAAGVTILGIVKKRLSWAGMKQALKKTLMTTGVLYAIIIGALIFTTFMAVSHIPDAIASFLVASDASNLWIMLGYLLCLLVLGTFLDGIAILTLTSAIFYPIVLASGINPIWYAILTIRALEVALMTPPLGMNVYVLKSLAPDIPLQTIFKGTIPFLLSDVLHIALLIAIPALTLYLTTFV